MFEFKRVLNSLLLMSALVPGAGTLKAQVNPTWRTKNSPDFLDLYQLTGTTGAKPEIITIFDFSGSMQSLMYHPCYYNANLNDNGDPDGFGITFTLTGAKGSYKVTATVGTNWFTTTTLVKPDGSVVTESDVAATDTNTTTNPLWGNTSITGNTGGQTCDVRNWVRAASHIRLTALDGTRTRTIDLPIPWKVMDRNSTGAPLSSMTVPNTCQVTDASGVVHTYGTGHPIEVDTRYKIQTGFPDADTQDNNMVLSGGKSEVVTRTKFMIRLNKAYLNWLFSGKYQNTTPGQPDYNVSLAGQYIAFDAANISNVGLQTRVNQGQGFGTFLTGEDALQKLVIPARDRVQAVKEAAIRTWINYQTRVFWAFRFLDGDGEAAGGAATTINSDSRNTITTGDPTSTWMNGKDSGWTLMNPNTANGNNSENSMARIAAMFPYTNTPLCYATARALAQFTDANNVFKDVETGADATVPCQQHFLMIFTDGVPTSDNKSDQNTDTPYITTSGGNTGTADAGNQSLITNPSGINPGSSWWNIFTYAGAAAHLADDSKQTYTKDTPITHYMTPGTYPGTSSPSQFLPFAITSRNSVTITGTNRLVTTMTIGVSLGGKYTDPAGPKRRLFLSAAVGDPNRTSWDLSTLTPFKQNSIPDPYDSTKTILVKDPNSTYFFDATSTDLLVQYLGIAFDSTLTVPNRGETSVPVIPWIGSGISSQIYLATFTIPEGGGTVWSGDLRMYPTKEVTVTDPDTGSKTQTQVLDNTGNVVTSDLTSNANPGWSTAAVLKSKGWKSRKFFTRLESSGTNENPAIYSIPSTLATTDFDSGKPLYLVAGADSATKLKNLQWMMGSDKDGKTRTNLMGDILDCSPAFLEYTNVSSSDMPTALSSAWGDSTKANKHFRVIYVGTNQGVIHAFGEVSWDNNIGTTGAPNIIKAGVVDELWAFIPTDILKYCDYFTTSNNPHALGVNGAPCMYFLDVPATGKRSGNGMMDVGSTTERATVIMGLGKGGRSYYALDVRNPFSPQLGGSGNQGWALVPDEYRAWDATKKTDLFESATGAKPSVVENMGWSTCQPTIGRVLTGSGSSLKVRDLVFLGGGFSLPEIEANWPTTGAKTPLGRSVLAMDVTTGKIVTFWELASTNGPVGAGVMPMQVAAYAGLTQRAYFTDFNGGLWALGSTKPDPDTVNRAGFRVDSSNIGDWATTPRPVYHQDRPDGVLSTMPAPFQVANFYPRTSAPFVVPQTMGIALVSGDRNNPMDRLYTSSGNVEPSQHRLTVVFDRQDSNKLNLDANGIQTSQLENLTSQNDPSASKIQPGSADFYLNSKYGYYINFPTRTGSSTFVAKGLITPMVLSGKLFYSYFLPLTSDACNPGTGATSTARVCNVMTPSFPGVGKSWSASDNKTAVQGCISGELFVWTGVASQFSPKSVLSAVQGGVVPAASNPKDNPPDMKIKSFDGNLSQAIAGPKVWRTVR